MWTVASTLNEFKLLRYLGSGAFGEAWLAEHEVPARNEPSTVVLKISKHVEKQDEFVAEAKKLAGLDHKNIVRFFRTGRTLGPNECVFLVIEYMTGGDLAARIRAEGKLAESEAAGIAIQFLEALEYSHARGFVHMDVKPPNILFDSDRTAKLSDFGLAKFVASTKHLSKFRGTEGYAAPEVYRNEVYEASDLWSAGIVLHEMLTGRRPFEAGHAAALMKKVLEEPPALSPSLSPGMKQIILRALQKDPSRRYSSASVMRAALEGQRAGRPVAEDASTITQAPLEVDIEFVRIPPGEFDMGSEHGDLDEEPVHQVRISKAFEMGKYPVTQAQWEAVMGGNPSHFKGADRPVETVSWDDVQEFLKKLNAGGDGHLYRLPTEAEWEYAARAGTKSDSSAELDAVAWYYGNSEAQTHPVGQKQPNAWGLYDMLGNVWEWCRDWYSQDYYRNSPTVDPPGPPSGSQRVLRGGSWSDVPGFLRASCRDGNGPGSGYSNLGCRCVREVIP